MIIRWIGAYRNHGQSLHQALAWEFTSAVEKAAEFIPSGGQTGIGGRARVGLLCQENNTVARFGGDVWSERGADGRLTATQKQDLETGHSEVFLPAQAGWKIYTGVVIAGKITPSTQRTVEFFARRYTLPVYQLREGGRLVKK